VPANVKPLHTEATQRSAGRSEVIPAYRLKIKPKTLPSSTAPAGCLSRQQKTPAVGPTSAHLPAGTLSAKEPVSRVANDWSAAYGRCGEMQAAAETRVFSRLSQSRWLGCPA